MQQIALVLAVLACTGQSRQVAVENEMNDLASLLLASNPPNAIKSRSSARSSRPVAPWEAEPVGKPKSFDLKSFAGAAAAAAAALQAHPAMAAYMPSNKQGELGEREEILTGMFVMWDVLAVGIVMGFALLSVTQPEKDSIFYD
jgi:hypothetical protein